MKLHPRVLAAAFLLIPFALRAQDGAFDAPARPASAGALKAPEPDAAAQKEAENLVRDIHKADYAKKAPADLQAFAGKLLQEGLETKDDPAARFVLLREAREVAAQAGDARTAFAAVDEAAKQFDIDAFALKSGALADAARAAKSPEAAGGVADACLDYFDAAVDAEKYDAAVALASKAESAAKASQDASLLARVQARNREMADFQREFQRLKAAEKTLETKPDDPAAHASIGRYFILVRGDWEMALPMLARGPEGPVRAAAQREMVKPEEGAAKVAAGDAWFEAAEKEKAALLKERLLDRARHWYESALASLSGLSKAKIEKRLAEMDAAAEGSGKAIDLLRLIDPAKDGIRGQWRLDGRALVTPATDSTMLQIPYELPDEYTLDLVVERKGRPECFYLALAVAGRPFGFEIDGWGGDVAILLRIDGRGINGSPNETLRRGTVFAENKPSAIRATVRKSRITLTFDGRTLVDWKADPNRLSMGWQIPNGKAAGIGSWRATYRITKLSLTPISGQGKKLR